MLISINVLHVEKKQTAFHEFIHQMHMWKLCLPTEFLLKTVENALLLSKTLSNYFAY